MSIHFVLYVGTNLSVSVCLTVQWSLLSKRLQMAAWMHAKIIMSLIKIYAGDRSSFFKKLLLVTLLLTLLSVHFRLRRYRDILVQTNENGRYVMKVNDISFHTFVFKRKWLYSLIFFRTYFHAALTITSNQSTGSDVIFTKACPFLSWNIHGLQNATATQKLSP